MSEDAYQELGELYLALVTSDEAKSLDIPDAHMSDWIVSNLPSKSRVLDAGCGLGFHLVALRQGLPRRQTQKQFEVFGSDYSAAMLSMARNRGVRVGIPASSYRQSSFAGLRQFDDWADAFDCAIINFGLYSYPSSVSYSDYDNYLFSSIKGVHHVLRPGGSFLFNMRDWASLVGGRTKTIEFENVHDEIVYRCQYVWQFGLNRDHSAQLRLSNLASGIIRETSLCFAQRDPDEISGVLERAGFTIESITRQDGERISLHTYVARRT